MSEEHLKYYSDGIEIPSCTQIVGLLDKPGLSNWANYMGFKRINTSKYLEEKAEYGTYCHKLAEVYFTDGLISANTNSNFLSKDEYRDMIYKFKMLDLYFEKYKIKCLNNEFRLQGNTYGGTLDMICYDGLNDQLTILDFKTSKELYQSHWIQLMGYAQLVEEIYNIPVGKVGVILLSQEYTSKNLINIKDTKSLWRELNIFNKLKDIYYFINKTEDEIKTKGVI